MKKTFEMQEVWYTFSKATPRAAVNQLHQYARHVVGAQHAVDNTDAVKKGKKYSPPVSCRGETTGKLIKSQLTENQSAYLMW